jgi:hypothetical protein
VHDARSQRDGHWKSDRKQFLFLPVFSCFVQVRSSFDSRDMHKFEAAAGYRLADIVWFGVTKRAK